MLPQRFTSIEHFMLVTWEVFHALITLYQHERKQRESKQKISHTATQNKTYTEESLAVELRGI